MTVVQRRLALALACLVTVAGVAFLVVDDAGSDGQDDPGAAASIPADGTEALATPVLSARRVPTVLRSHAVDERLRSVLEPLVEAAPPDSCVVVREGGRTILSHRGEEPMAPASVQKLLLAAAVLETFGPEHRLKTTALAQGEPDDGVVEGDLYLVGGGDPLLTTSGYQLTLENPQQLSNDFSKLADRLVDAGVREIRGGIVADESRYDDVRAPSSWPDRYMFDGHVGPLSALMVNDGSTGFTDDPARGDAHRVPGEPAILAAETLITLLEQRGIQVELGASRGRAPEDAFEVAALESLPMADLVTELISDSDNTTAELLTKELGVHRSGSGTTAEGLRAVIDATVAAGLPADGLNLVDGSGLDVGNRLSCETVVAALDSYGRDSVVGRSLAVAGETGTLRRRMQGTPAEGAVFAKTGTLNTVNALAGYAQLSSGGDLTFAFMINGDEQPRGYAPLDVFAAAMAGVVAGPALETLAPLSPPG